MIKALIIDDEPLARDLVKEYLKDFQQITLLEECNNGFEGYKSIKEHRPDLIFLDVQMPKISGFELLEMLDEQPKVIFTTAFDEYAIKAFEANAIDYLLKPFSKERFQKSVEKALSKARSIEKPMPSLTPENTEAPLQRILVKKNNNIRIVPNSEILYLETYDDYVKIHTAEETYLKNKTMSYFEQQLDPKDFIRIHRSYLVALSQITRVEQMEKDAHVVLLKNGTRLAVSRQGYDKLKAAFGS